MLFLISLVIASLFTIFCGDLLKKHPVPFYIGAAVISLFFAVFPFKGAPGFVKDYILALLQKGSLAAAFFVIVMFAGAFKAGSKGAKKLMPIRAELAILASALILTHIISYGFTYIKRLLKSSLSPTMTWLTILSVVMVLLLIPLTVTSFKKVRKAMNAKKWKNLQRFAYAFYMLLLVHILFAYIPSAQRGNVKSIISVAVYSIVFTAYAVMRTSKALVKKHKDSEKTIRISTNAGGLVILGIIAALVAVPAMTASKSDVPVSESVSSVSSSAASTPVSEENTDTSSASSVGSDVSKASDSDKNTSSDTSSKDSSADKSSDKASSKSTSSKNTSSEASSSSANSSKTASNASSKSTSSKASSSKNTSSKAAAPSAASSSAAPSSEGTVTTVTGGEVELPFVPSEKNEETDNNDGNNNNVESKGSENNNDNNNNNEPQPGENETPIMTVEEEVPEEEPHIYNDGRYTAKKYVEDEDDEDIVVLITVTITIEDDRIVDLEVESDETDPWYLNQAYDPLKQQIIDEQRTDLDTITGATLTSRGILDSVKDALEQARIK